VTAGDSPRRASLFHVARTVLAGFFGVRRRTAHDRDAAHASPLQIVVVGVALAAIFVFTLVAIVRVVTGQ
jgi:hypothetical protein